MSDDTDPKLPPPDDAVDDGNDSAVLAKQKQGSNDFFRRMMDRNFLDYASYVIGSRAIPDVDDGLKPVQRRILWTLYQIYNNGLTTKSANVVGNAMHYHPHGDASIADALTVLANKGGCVEKLVKDPKTGKEETHFITTPYFIATEGNFGNILTGSEAAATRYTECSLTRMAYETMFDNDITELIPNYDGRKKEPVLLPAKVPSLLMMGSDGIAVGMSTTVLPHNFNELIDAEIAELRGEPFQLFPDFPQGGLMDVREYEDGNGRITLRAKIDIEGRDLVIREIPATTNSKSLLMSIKKAAEKNKIRISYMEDFTTDHAEIRITPTRGYDPEKTRQGLYMYTDCSVSISPKMVVICDRRPQQMSVTGVLKRNVGKLLEYLRQEFEIDLERQNELAHAKTLAQLFFENRIYKRIEECKNQEEEYAEVQTGLAPFRDQLKREITTEDIDRLLALPVRRIARFDIEKNQRELREIAAKIKEIRHHLAHLTEYAISYLENIKKEYGANFPRRTEIEQFEQIDRTKAALNNIKIGWDRKNGYIGTAVKSDDTVVCNEFDRFVCVEKSGKFKIIPLPPDKLYVGKLYDFRRYDAATEFGVIYKESRSGKYYGKRSRIGGFILDKEYNFCPEGCRLELLTPRPDAIYIIHEQSRGEDRERELDLMELPLRNPKARGSLIGDKPWNKVVHSRYLTPEELSRFIEPEPEPDAEEEPVGEPEEEAAAAQEPMPAAEDRNEQEPAPAEPEPPSPAVPDGAGPVTAEVPETEALNDGPEQEPPDAEAQNDEAETKPEKEKETDDEDHSDSPGEPPPPQTEEDAAEDATAEDADGTATTEVDGPEQEPPEAEEQNVEPDPKPSEPATDEEVPPPSSGGEEEWALSGDPDAPVRRHHPRQRQAAVKPPKPPDDGDDDLGIIQPEFGF